MDWDFDWEIVDGLSDFMDEGGFCFFLGGLIRILWFIIKLLIFAGYYTLPVWIVLAGFAGGGTLGSEKGQAVYDKYEEERIEELTHTVTIYRADNTKFTIQVREDQNWTVEGYSGYDYTVPFSYDESDEYLLSDGNDDSDYDYYYGSSSSQSVVEKMDLDGNGSKVFIGLYSSPDGGTCFANGSGCGIKDITEDITLYAVYRSYN